MVHIAPMKVQPRKVQLKAVVDEKTREAVRAFKARSGLPIQVVIEEAILIGLQVMRARYPERGKGEK